MTFPGKQPYNEAGDTTRQFETTNTFTEVLHRLTAGIHLGTALDVGAGNGRLSAVLATKFAHVVAIEPQDNFHPKFMRHIEAVKTTLEKFQTEAKFDFILFWGVFMYMTDKVAALEKCKSMLNPGGIIAICDHKDRSNDRCAGPPNQTCNYNLGELIAATNLTEKMEFVHRDHYRCTILTQGEK